MGDNSIREKSVPSEKPRGFIPENFNPTSEEKTSNVKVTGYMFHSVPLSKRV